MSQVGQLSHFGAIQSITVLYPETKNTYLSFSLYILPHALTDILGRLAQRLLVSDRKS